ncbi:cyclic nucleotide-binding protein [Lentzea sp. NBRC 105346]|uniref:Crp/Fnr family transcriptional regulator n=1 Tax=Lentzea sp. NBRC 105346 TaxID=3032205 RepID=UPI0024A17142|nr:Crp/Fnr family transcriptional regulator [Lentzea sp. NBRC 105346]GLZ33147.1 cyclic nucleotide-binding protein [Lentzea sp. NBRC 105346]
MNFWDMLLESTRQDFLAQAVERRYKTGKVIINEGDRAGWVLVLTVGRAKVVTSAGGGHDVVLGVREPGDIIGEMAAVDGNPRSASVIAVEDVTALWLPAQRFARLMREPDVSSALLKIISGRLRTANVRRAEYGDRTTFVRLASLLNEIVLRYGVRTRDGVLITLRISQQDLAGLISASREAVARALRELREDGVLTTGRQRMIVHRPEVLEEIVNASASA